MLPILFFIVAAVYACVGFGGGSSYLALLVLWNIPYTVVPIIALMCNIIVVSGNSVHYVRSGYINKKLLLPPAMASVPMAYFGGQLSVDKDIFIFILFFALAISGLRLLITFKRYTDNCEQYVAVPLWLSLTVGALLGLLAGVVGIGGGIFLAPILYSLRAGTPKQIAATASVFILVNSVAGLIGQAQKTPIIEVMIQYWYLPIVVFIGGQIGNILTIKVIPTRVIVLITALLILFVAARIGWHAFNAT